MTVRIQASFFDDVLSRNVDALVAYSPVVKSGAGRFSDTDVVRYRAIDSIADCVWDRKSEMSAKEVVLPITQKLFSFSERATRELICDDTRIILLFARACDINAINRLDRIFLENGGVPDPYYAALRGRVVFALMECPQPFDSCFCVAMGTSTTTDYGMIVRPDADGFLVDICDERLKKIFGTVDHLPALDPLFAQTNGTPVAVPDVATMPESLYAHEFWDEYSARCIACGRCNTSCPTCSCFNTHDVINRDDPDTGLRRRVWGGCHLDGFSNMAGGHSFRVKYGARMRFKVFHKVYDYKKRFGTHMCVGCGRCDDVCPEYISYSNCLTKFSKLLDVTGEAV